MKSYAPMERMLHTLFWCGICITVYLGMASQAMAFNLGDLLFPSTFGCFGSKPYGSLMTVTECANEFSSDQVFSYFICRYENILNDILSSIYCGITDFSKGPVLAVLTLMVVLAGVSFTMGIIDFSAKELSIIAFKFALVLAFATEAEYMIGVGYTLFMSFAKQGIIIITNEFIDATYNLSMSMNLSASGKLNLDINSAPDIYRTFDQVIYRIIFDNVAGEEQGANRCNNALLVMVMAAGIAVPPLALAGAYFIMKIFWVLLRAVFGYCQGLLGITFLVIFAPIYVSFSLFRATRPMFEKWIQYLISFSFQMVLVFGFLGFMFAAISQSSSSVASYASLVHPLVGSAATQPGIMLSLNTCGICKMEQTGPFDDPRCVDADGDGVPDKILSMTELTAEVEILEFATYKIIAIALLFWLFDIMLSFVPTMATYLAGLKHAATLGGGTMMGGGAFADRVPIPGSAGLISTANAAGKGFASSGNTPEAVVGGIMSAIQGSEDGGVYRGGVLGSGGMIDGMIRGIANPQDPFRKP